MTEDEVIVPEPKRRCKLPAALSNSVMLSSVGQSDDAGNESVIHKRILLGILDNCIVEARFGESNTGVLSAIVSLWPASECFLEPKNIKHLAQLLGLDADSMLMSSELVVAKAFISKGFKPDEHRCVGDVCSLLYPMQTAFPSVYQLFAAVATFGASSATCEASFSTLTSDLMSYRRSMTHEHKKNLVILAFLRSYTKNVNVEEVLRCFCKNSRKLQLF